MTLAYISRRVGPARLTIFPVLGSTSSLLSLPLPVITCRESGISSSDAACQNGSYIRLLYGRSSGAEPQIIAPRSPILAQRSSSLMPSPISSSETNALPTNRFGLYEQNSASQSL